MEQFVDRTSELDRLKTLYESDTAELAVVFGRRQIGKSELVRQSIQERDDAVYYQAVQGTPTTQLTRFIEAAETHYPSITTIKEDWELLLGHLTAQDAVIVIDEFPYLVDSDESLPSVIQHLWDTGVDDSSSTLVLTGSAIGMMYTHVLDGGAPLYGRVSQTPNGRIELTDYPSERFKHLSQATAPKSGSSPTVYSVVPHDISNHSIRQHRLAITSPPCFVIRMVRSTPSLKPSFRWNSQRSTPTFRSWSQLRVEIGVETRLPKVQA